MLNLMECALSRNNTPKNNVYYNVAVNRTDADTMSFLGTLSPVDSSVDSTDAKMETYSLSSPHELLGSTLFINANYQSESNQPYLKIIEQPIEKFRFRYKSEMAGTHGSLIGVNSDKIRKSTYPTVQLENFKDRAFIRCSIYQIKSDIPHAHRLVMKSASDFGEKDDPHDIEISPERGYTAIFKSMGIIHTAKKYLVEELYKKLRRIKREELNRDGVFRNMTLLEEAEIKRHCENEAKNINLNKVRLKFEAFCEILENGGKYLQPLCQPVYSHGINNLKSALTGELKIVRLDHTTASCVGGQEIYILVEKVTKNNIKVRFFECDDEDNEIWEDYGKFNPNDVHHQYAIVFKTPPYKDVNIENPVNVCMELVRPTDGARSEPRIFKYKPSEKIGRKRPRNCESFSSSDVPTTINNTSLESIDSVTESLIRPLNPNFFSDLNNIESDEFNKIFLSASPDYENLQTDGTNTDCMAKEDGLAVKLCKKVVTDLTVCLKTSPPSERFERLVVKLFTDFRTTPEENNALHCAIITGQNQHLFYMLLLIAKMKHLKICNIQNKNGQTALHLAVLLNASILDKILLTGADPNITDKNGNTPLNLAIVNNFNLNAHYSKLINETALEKDNYDGHTPLYSAVLKGNIKNVKLLVQAHADVNHKIPSTGNTILHLAIEEKHKDMVKYLLEETTARLDVENHSKLTPVHLANVLLSEGSDSELIFNIICDYVKSRGFECLIIKEEPDDDVSSEVSEGIREIKLELNSPDDEEVIEREILKNALFTNECITELGKILDGTENLDKLSKELSFHQIQCSLDTLTTKLLLNFANVNGINVLMIRQVLKKYNIQEAIDVIDNLYP